MRTTNAILVPELAVAGLRSLRRLPWVLIQIVTAAEQIAQCAGKRSPRPQSNRVLDLKYFQQECSSIPEEHWRTSGTRWIDNGKGQEER
jgi:hypothetical protein